MNISTSHETTYQTFTTDSSANCQSWAAAEAINSGIPTDLWQANIEIGGGWPLLELLADPWSKQQQHTYINQSTKRLATRYQSVMEDGAWLAYGWQPAGVEIVPIIKPVTPRRDLETNKPIKYETPAKKAAPPFFAWIPYSYGLKIAQGLGKKELTAYQERIGLCNVAHIDTEFWPWAIERSWPITITEGVKKSLALISQGIPAIGLRGITMWRTPKTNELHPSLKPFIKKKRKWLIALDQDTKPSTRAAVRGQILKFGKAIDRQGGKVFILEWDGAKGKGIDDLLVAAGDLAPTELLAIIQNARSLSAYRQDLKTTFVDITNLQGEDPGTPTTGHRLAPLPELLAGELLAVDASMGTGKTYRLNQDLIQPAITLGRLVVVIAPNINLGKQFAQTAGLCHIHDYGARAVDGEALKADVYNRGGVVLCLDSLARLLTICSNLTEQQPLVIFDEVNQVFSNATAAGTLGKRQPVGIKALSNLVQSAYAIAIAEYGIPDRCLDLIQAMARGSNKFLRSISHANGQPQGFTVKKVYHRHNFGQWPVKMYQGRDSGFLGTFFAAVEAGGRHYFASTSKTKLKQLELLLTEAFPAKKVVRIDSETVEGGAYEDLFRDPDTWLRTHQPDILIGSPTIQSGISFDGDKDVEDSYFTAVWGHFGTLSPDLHLQMLARVRPGVPRHIWIPDSIRRAPEEYNKKPWSQLRYWQQHADFQAKTHGLEAPSELSELETAMQTFHAKDVAVTGLIKTIAFGYVKHKLEEEGHLVEVIATESDKTIAESFRGARDLLELTEAAAIACEEINPDVHTPDWAREELGAISSTVASRRKANKVLARERFPSELFDTTESALRLVRNWGTLGRQAELRAAAENPQAERLLEKAAVTEILTAEVRSYHRLPKRGNQAQILADIGILELIESGEEYSSQSQRVQDIAAKALVRERHLWQFFNLNINEGQTSVEIVHKILKRLGFEVDREKRPGAIVLTSRTGPIGHQVQHYQITAHPDPIYKRLLLAARARRAAIAAISKGDLDSLENHCKTEQTHISGQLEGSGAETAWPIYPNLGWEEDSADWPDPPEDDLIDCGLEAIDD